MAGNNNHMMALTIRALNMCQDRRMGAVSLDQLTTILHGNMEQMTGERLNKDAIPVEAAVRKMNGNSIYHHLLPQGEIKTDYSGQ